MNVKCIEIKLKSRPKMYLIKAFSYLGHLTGSDINVPSEHIAGCITKFLICSDTQSGMELINSRNNCYQDFQSCSGSKIEISEGIFIKNSTENGALGFNISSI